MEFIVIGALLAIGFYFAPFIITLVLVVVSGFFMVIAGIFGFVVDVLKVVG